MNELNMNHSFINRLLNILGILFFMGAFYYSFQIAFKFVNADVEFVVAFLVVAVLILFSSFLITIFLSKSLYISVIVMLAFLLRLIWVLWIPTPIESDFSVMYSAALKAAAGDYSYNESIYYTKWVYQWGFTMYQAFIIMLFGDSPFVLKFLNILYSTATVVIVYLIASKAFSEACGRIAGFVYAIYIPSILMSSVLTNQHLSTFLFYLAFYFLINKGLSHKYSWLFIGLFVALGHIIRPLGSFVLLAIVIFVIISYFIKTNKETKITAVKKMIGIFAVYYLVVTVVSQSFIAMGVTEHTLSNRDPLWKFVVGLNYDTTGRWNKPDDVYVSSIPLGEERKQAEVALIKERTEDKKQLLLLVTNKFRILWGDVDASVQWSLRKLDEPSLQRISQISERLLYINIILFALISMINLTIQNNKKEHLFFLLLILGYAAVHLIIEIQTRYRYFIIPSFVIIQSYGVYLMYMFIGEKFKLFNKKVHL